MHLYKSQIFEAVRASCLLANSAAVVAEVNPDTSMDPIYRDGICAAPYEGLVEACVSHVKRNDLRVELQRKAYTTIARYPQTQFIRGLISAN